MKHITLIIATAASVITLNAQTTAPEAPAKKELRLSPSSTPVHKSNRGWWQKRHLQLVKEANTNTAQRQLVFIGDSITQSWETQGKKVWQSYFHKWNALNLGISADHTSHVLWRLQNGEFPDTLKPKVAVVMIGTNNTGHGQGQPAEETAAGIKLIVDEIHTRSPGTQIILNAIFPRAASPSNKRRQLNDEINKLISKLGERDYVHYLDISPKFLDKQGKLEKAIMPDLLHPNEKGYKIWAEAILPTIKKLIK